MSANTKTIDDKEKKLIPATVSRIKKKYGTGSNTRIKINDYTFVQDINHDTSDFMKIGSSIEITKKDKLVYKEKKFEHDWDFDGACVSMDGDPGCIPKAGECLTGDGNPTLVISWWTGGAYCCSKYLIFSLGKEFKVLNYIFNGCSGLQFKDVDNDGTTELIGRDWTYQEFWWSGDKTFIAPVIIWKFMDGKYVICPEVMKKAPPSDAEMQKFALQEKDEGRYGTFLAHYLLDLVYTGNGNLEEKFYDIFSKTNKYMTDNDSGYAIPDKKEFLDDFNGKLKKSIYWEYVKKLNNW